MVGANCSVFGCLSGNAKYVYLREKFSGEFHEYEANCKN